MKQEIKDFDDKKIKDINYGVIRLIDVIHDV